MLFCREKGNSLGFLVVAFPQILSCIYTLVGASTSVFFKAFKVDKPKKIWTCCFCSFFQRSPSIFHVCLYLAFRSPPFAARI